MSIVKGRVPATTFANLDEWIKATNANTGQMLALNASQNFGEAMVDPLRELGVQRQKIERNQAYRAMTDAAEFVKERETELNALDGQIKAKYYSEFAEYAASGYTTEQCKKKALVSKIAPTLFANLQQWIDKGADQEQMIAFNASGNLGEAMVDPLRELGVQRQKIERNQAYRAMTDAKILLMNVKPN